MKLVALVGVGLVGLTLTASAGPAAEPLLVTGLGLPKKATVAEPPVARISGHYPTPLWQFDRWGMTIKGNTVELVPYGINQQKPDQMVAQVLLPYQLPKVLTGLRPGKWTVVAKGKDKEYRSTVEIADAAMQKGFPYLETITLPATAPAGKTVSMTVEGHLPDTAWKPLAAEVKVGDGIVWVYPWAERSRKAFGAEMLTPATWKLTLPALPAGDYLVVVEGHNETQKKPLKVQ